ncbi:MAG: S41 family peptidase [bacterium]|nr:S41 family peptidase [bacterium]
MSINIVKKAVLAGFVVILLFTAFSAGKYIGKTEPICGVLNLEQGKPEGVDFSLFWDVWRILQEKYVDKSKLTAEKMVVGAISGMVESLEDPYTSFFTEQESKEILEDLSGKFEGVGMEVGIKDETIVVVAPIGGTPAQKAGILAGDKILAIDEKTTRGMALDKAVKLIRGTKGTTVKLIILRENWEESKEIKIIRDLIEIPSYKLEFKEDIAYLRLYQFFSKTSTDFTNAVNEIVSKNPKGIILDLRDNPGGYLEVARDIASWFIEKNEVVVIEDFGNGEQKIHKANGRSFLKNFPMVVIVNKGSASASEILAGALRDDRGIKLIGEKTFGKGSVQELQGLLGGSSVKITIAKWLTPKGNLIDGVGLEPDVEVKFTEEEMEQKKDPQLEKAMEIIKSISN